MTRIGMATCLALVPTLAGAEIAVLHNGATLKLRGWRVGEDARLVLRLADGGELTTSFAEVAAIVPDEVAVPGEAVSPAPQSAPDLVRRWALRYGVDPALIDAVVWAESAYRPDAVSPRGAMGLMQLMPDTAAALGVRDPFEPSQNVDAGVRYLRDLIDRYGGDLRQALAAYNAGPAAVQRHGGVPPFPETVAYVSRVLGRYEAAR